MCGFRHLQSDGCFWLWLSCKISGIEDQKLDLQVDRVAKWHSVPVKRSTPSPFFICPRNPISHSHFLHKDFPEHYCSCLPSWNTRFLKFFPRWTAQCWCMFCAQKQCLLILMKLPALDHRGCSIHILSLWIDSPPFLLHCLCPRRLAFWDCTSQTFTCLLDFG